MSVKNGAIRIALLYVLVGFLWITLSDKIVLLFYGSKHPKLLQYINSLKGFAYVLLTGWLLYLLIKKQHRQAIITEKKINAANDGLHLLNKNLSEQQKQLGDIQQLAQLGGWQYFPQTGSMVCSDEIYYILDFAWPGEPDPWQNIIRHVHLADKEVLEKNVSSMRKEGTGFSQIFRITDEHQRLKYLYIIANAAAHSGTTLHIRGTLQDITGSKELEEQKDRYLLRLENTLNSISDAFCVLDDNMIVRAINPMFASLAGLPKEDLLNHPITEFWPQVPGDAFYDHLMLALGTRETLRFEYQSHAKKWLRVVAYPNAEGVAFYFTDITESKEKDIQLQRALDRYNLVAHATEDMFYEFDIRENRLTYSQGMDGIPNPAFINEEDPTKAWFSIIHPDDLPMMMEANQKSLRERSPRYECEYRIDFGNHQYRYVSDKAYIQYDNGEPVRMVGAIRDINELKKTAEENKLLGRVISHVNNKVMITDTGRCILWCNRAFEEVSGYRLEEIRNRLPQDVIGGPNPSNTIVNDITQRCIRQEVFSKELPFYRSDGKFSWVKADFTPLYNDKNEFTGYITVYANINELKEKQASLEAQNNTLREIAWLESHEMRRPLSSILGLVGLIKDSKDEAEKKYLFGLLDTSARELDSMVMKISQKIHESPGIKRPDTQSGTG